MGSNGLVIQPGTHSAAFSNLGPPQCACCAVYARPLISCTSVGLHGEADLPFSLGSWKAMNLEATNFSLPSEHLGNFLAFPKGSDLCLLLLGGSPSCSSQPLLPKLWKWLKPMG